MEKGVIIFPISSTPEMSQLQTSRFFNKYTFISKFKYIQIYLFFHFDQNVFFISVT